MPKEPPKALEPSDVDALKKQFQIPKKKQ